MQIQPGQTLLHYRISEKLGEGGMGVVWKAVDSTLGREVAIKILPEAFAGDSERLARFEQEARLLASLNHPNIAAVYSVHQHEGMRFLAMELVAGEDLSQRLARGPLPIDEALEIALQIADALGTAHDSGVIHRDLKPANVQLTPAGKIKVLDFGLAKALAPESASGDASLSPTITSAGTMVGMILGTAGYMSPEQARGRQVDRRADIWAFGALLYEMLTGRRAFDGETVSDTLASVLKTDPEWEALPAATPPAVRRLLRRCLTRDVDKRLSHISGARAPLREILDGTLDAGGPVEPLATTAPQSSWSRIVPWALVTLLVLAVAVLGWQASRERGAESQVLTLVAPFPDELTIPNDQMGILALSPDGRTLALVLQENQEKRLYVRKLDSATMTALPGTDNAATPFFSPDGKWIGFFSGDRLRKVSIDGGNPITLCDAVGNNRGASWGTDGFIVYSPHYTEPLMRVPEGGGSPTRWTEIEPQRGERTHRWPFAVPDKDVVLFTVGTMDSPENYDGSRIDAIRPSTGERKTVLEGASLARYLLGGHLIFAREGFLFGVAFDIDRLEVRGNPIPVVENVMGMRSSGVVYADFAESGLLAYVSGTPRSREHRLVWRYRDGRSEPLAVPVAGYAGPRLSPDRKQIAIGVEGDSTFDVWTFDVERETLTRLTFEGDNTMPVWAPDGKRVAFASVRDDDLLSTYIKPADGSGEAELLYSPASHANAGQTIPSDWSPDGRFLLVEFSNERGTNFLALSMEDGQSQVLLETPASEQNPVFSPDGRWVAYTSDETGLFEIYVRPFPGPGGKWQISSAGGFNPRWSADGKELFFRWQDRLYVTRIDASGSSLQVGRPELLFDGFPPPTIDGDYDVADSERFLLVEVAGEETAPEGVTVVVNWLDELRRLLPN